MDISVRRTFSKIVSHPKIYKFQKALLRGEKLDARLEQAVGSVSARLDSATIINIGGGSATSRAMWPDSWKYISIDPDARVLSLENSESKIERILGNAEEIPLPDNFADVVLMESVSHHLDESTWISSLTEINRVIKPNGYFIFLDGVWSPRRWISRIFWRLDAGWFPKTSNELEISIKTKFEVESVEKFTLIHECILIIANPKKKLNNDKYYFANFQRSRIY